MLDLTWNDANSMIWFCFWRLSRKRQIISENDTKLSVWLSSCRAVAIAAVSLSLWSSFRFLSKMGSAVYRVTRNHCHKYTPFLYSLTAFEKGKWVKSGHFWELHQMSSEAARRVHFARGRCHFRKHQPDFTLWVLPHSPFVLPTAPLHLPTPLSMYKGCCLSLKVLIF